MKKCPFCKADIEDNARFCLYCMKSLNEKEVIPSPQSKKPWWLLGVVAVLLAAALLIVKGPREVPDQPQGGTDAPTESTQMESTAPTDVETQPTTDPTAVEEPTEATQPATVATQPQTQAHTTTPATKPTLPPTMPTEPTSAPTKPTPLQTAPTEVTTAPTVATTVPTNAPTQVPTQKPTQAPTIAATVPTEPTAAPTEATTAPTAPKQEVVYTYRDARAGDDFSANYQNAGNDIVITGIAQPAADGVYDIPDFIDGKKVIAIVANAFSGSNATTVYVPAMVKTIWNHAFADCGLADIYFRGNAIYAEGKAFPAGVTIHCTAGCSDRNFRYYKNTAANYGATWQEWNG